MNNESAYFYIGILVKLEKKKLLTEPEVLYRLVNNDVHFSTMTCSADIIHQCQSPTPRLCEYLITWQLKSAHMHQKQLTLHPVDGAQIGFLNPLTPWTCQRWRVCPPRHNYDRLVVTMPSLLTSPRCRTSFSSICQFLLVWQGDAIAKLNNFYAKEQRACTVHCEVNPKGNVKDSSKQVLFLSQRFVYHHVKVFRIQHWANLIVHLW